MKLTWEQYRYVDKKHTKCDSRITAFLRNGHNERFLIYIFTAHRVVSNNDIMNVDNMAVSCNVAVVELLLLELFFPSINIS